MIKINLRFVSQIAALAVAIPTSAVLLYLLFLRKEDDETDTDYKAERVETSRQTLIQVTVPSKAVGTVIGVRGATIKQIQHESGAKVTFNDRNAEGREEDDRLALVRGDTASAQKAEMMIRQIIADMPDIVTEEVLVPGYCLGRLIGRGGENIRAMSQTSNCKIMVDKSKDSRHTGDNRPVTITGPQDRIEQVKSMIEGTVAKENMFRAQNKGKTKEKNEKQSEASSSASEQLTETVSLPSRVVEPEATWDSSGDMARPMVPEAYPVEDCIEVFVSAVEHPEHFWLQTVGTAALKLDELITKMTAVYSAEDSMQVYGLCVANEGDIVAAPFEHDSMWYRARVVGQEGDKLDLYYFDFGDSGFMPLQSLRMLRPEYHSLPVQAIECKLAGVKPTGDKWSEAACQAFEDLTYCSEWRVLEAEMVGYMPEMSVGQRPCVRLVDRRCEPPKDIAAELVSRGLAEWDTTPHAPSSSSSPAAPVATEMVRPDFQPCT